MHLSMQQLKYMSHIKCYVNKVRNSAQNKSIYFLSTPVNFQ